LIQKSSTNLMSILKSMTDFELALADLYRTCSQIWLADKEFWADMEKAELKHAENINKMNKLVSEKPDHFEPGRLLKPAAFQTSILGIKWHIERLKKREISEKKMLFIARDLEQSILESSYSDVIKTSDTEFQTLTKEVFSDTVGHRERLDKKISGTSS
jgi:hypothetical protein